MTKLDTLKKSYAATVNIYHTMTLEEYVAFNLKGANEILVRCDCTPLTLEQYCSLAA